MAISGTEKFQPSCCLSASLVDSPDAPGEASSSSSAKGGGRFVVLHGGWGSKAPMLKKSFPDTLPVLV